MEKENIENKNTIIKTLTKKEKNKLNKDIEKALNILYHLEDITQYEIKEIGNCIDLLQNIKVENIFELEESGKN